MVLLFQNIMEHLFQITSEDMEWRSQYLEQDSMLLATILSA